MGTVVSYPHMYQESSARRSLNVQMNQLIRAMSVQTEACDLLKTSELLYNEDPATGVKPLEAQDSQVLEPFVEVIMRTPRSTSSNGSDAESATGHTEAQNLHPKCPITSTTHESRSSIPSWIMTPRQMDMLLHLHTGLTPRPTSDGGDTESPVGTIVENTARMRSDTSAFPLFETQDDNGNEEDDDQEHSNPRIYYAPDILGSVEENRSLQSQRLIERHRKKIQSLARYRTDNKNQRREIREEPEKLHGKGFFHRGVNRIVRDEMKQALEQKEKLVSSGR